MYRILLSLVIIATLNSCNNKSKSIASANTLETNDATYYLIRHADKQRGPKVGDDPVLNAKGKARAQFWAKKLKDIDFDAVYSTDFKRTRSTALPTAKKNKVPVTIYNTSDLYNEQFQAETRGKTVLIVGHSNTTPAFVNAILGTEKFGEIDDSTFGNLYIVRVHNGVAEAELKDFNSWNME